MVVMGSATMLVAAKRLTLLLSLLLLGCGFNKNYVLSAPTVGEGNGPYSVIKMPEISLRLQPRNELLTSEHSYVVLPIVPAGSKSYENPNQQLPKGKFVVELALFARQERMSLDFSEIVLKLEGEAYKVIDVVKSPYANYPLEQALSAGEKHVMCPKSQRVDAGLSNEKVELKPYGLWECYDLVFAVDTPSPHTRFDIEVSINNNATNVRQKINVPFEAIKWGHSDSFP